MQNLDIDTIKEGDTIFLAFPDAGYPADQVSAKECLEEGKKYEISGVDIQNWNTTIWLKGFDQSFNSVLFGTESVEN